MVRRNGYVKVLDFGLAKLTETIDRSPSDAEAATRVLVHTDAGIVMGTSHYMSPEQARGKPVDARSDIWSLGVVLYEMIAGRTPFEGETSTDVIIAITQKEPLPLARFAPNVPAELEWIVMKALRKDRDERYQTVKELITDLRRLKQRLEFQSELERSASPVSFTQIEDQRSHCRADYGTASHADCGEDDYSCFERRVHRDWNQTSQARGGIDRAHSHRCQRAPLSTCTNAIHIR